MIEELTNELEVLKLERRAMGEHQEQVCYNERLAADERTTP